MQIKDFVDIIKSVCANTGMALNDESIINNAVLLYINQRGGQNKATMEESNAVNFQSKASDKQKSFLEKLGYKEDMTNLTKDEATKIIEGLLKKDGTK